MLQFYSNDMVMMKAAAQEKKKEFYLFFTSGPFMWVSGPFAVSFA